MAAQKRRYLETLKPSHESVEVLNELISKQIDRRKNNEIPRPIGAAIILANQYCAHKEAISTPKHDINLMENLLQTLNFATAVKNFDHSVDKWKAGKMIAQIASLQLKQYVCFLFYYSGHADEHGMILPDGHVIEFGDVIQSLARCKSLEGKPKIVIFDCSRSLVPKAEEKKKPLTQADLPSDFLVIFSASHSNYAFGDRETGSFLTHDFVKAVQHYVHEQVPKNLSSVVDEVCKGVEEYVLRRSRGRHTQKPQVLNSLKGVITLPNLCKRVDLGS